MKRTIEIRAAEGGEDAKLFVNDLSQAYQRMAGRVGWKHRLIDVRPGEIILEIEGIDLSGLDNEPGGLRLQRVPPTERKGRVHTSTVTVSVLNSISTKKFELFDSDLKIEWYSGTGCGGQNRNKIMSSCRLTHLPTGLVQTSQTRSRTNSLQLAKAEMLTRLGQEFNARINGDQSLIRKNQVGSGMRGDKIRTIRFQDNSVIDHITGKRMQADKFMKGHMNELW